MVSHVPFWKRLAWMAVIWAVSVVALGIVTGAMRVWLSG